MRATVQPTQLAVVPGAPVAFVVEVVNELAVIDGITIAVDAPMGLDARIEPPLLPLFPDSSGQLAVVLTASPTFPCGPHHVTVEVRSSVDPSTSTTVGVALDVARQPVGDLAVVPPKRESRRRTSYTVHLSNRGNTTLDAALEAADADRRLRVRFAPPTLSVEPGGSGAAKLTVRSRRLLWGAPERAAVGVVATTPEGQFDASAELTTKPLVPSGARTLVVLGTIVAVWAAIFLVALNKAYSGDKLTKDVPPSFFASSPVAQTPKGRTALGALGTYAFETAAAESGGTPAGAVPKTGTAAGVGGDISGRVVAATTSAGVGRITVEAVRQSPEGPVLASSAATDDTGAYTLNGLLPGSYDVLFTCTGFQDLWWPAAATQLGAQAVTVTAQAATPHVDATITGLAASIAGQVVTGTAPARPVVVSVLPEQGQGSPLATVTSDATGHYTIPDLPAPGTYDLSFTAGGYQVASDTEQVAGGEAHAANTIVMSATPGSIAGTVTDGRRPLGGVAITAKANGKTFTTATPTAGTVGAFTLVNLPSPATYLLTFTTPDGQSVTLAQPVGPGQAVSGLSVTAAGGAGQVTGTVSGPGGAPLGGATVTVNGTAKPVSTSTLTAGQVGSYTLAGLATPGSYTLTFSAPGHQSQTVGLSLAPGGSASAVNAVLPSAVGAISGSVVTADGTPLAGVAVAATNGTATSATATTSQPPGVYNLSGLAPGAWTITYSQPGYRTVSALLKVVAGTTTTPPPVTMGKAG